MQTRAFMLLTAGLVVGVLALGLVVRFAVGDDAGPTRIGVTAPVPAGFAEALGELGSRLDRELEVSSVETPAAAREAVEDGSLDAAVIGGARRVIFAGEVDGEVQALIDQAWVSTRIREAILAAGVSPQRAAEILAPPRLEASGLDEEDEQEGVALLTGTLAAILLYIAIQTLGSYVLVGVVEEKSTAVIELLLARVAADRLLAGKVIGIGIAGLIQFGLVVLASLVSLTASGVDVPGEVWSAVPLTVVWFLAGYALYSTLYALAGSLVSRQEDAQAAAAPITTVLLGTYLLVFVFGNEPESTTTTLMSLFPPMAPLLMPMRMAAGAAPPWQVVLSLALLVATIVLVSKVAGRIYEQVVLQRGSRISWSAVFALARPGRAGA